MRLLQGSSKEAPLASRLPWWVSRTVPTSLGPLPVLVLKDGTMAVGLTVQGIDVYASDNAVLNRNASVLKDSLNILPAGCFLQAIFETGFDFEPLLRRYESMPGSGTSPIVKEARRRRVRMLRADSWLSGTRISYWLGLSGALGRLASHTSKPGFLSLLGQGRRHPSQLKLEHVTSGAVKLAGVVQQFRDSLDTMGVATALMSESAMLAELFRQLNPGTSRLVGPPVIIETREDLAGLSTDQRVLFRGPGLSSQLAAGPMTWSADRFSLDDPPLLHRVLGIQRYPVATQPDWLFALQYKHMPETPMRLVVTHMATDRQVKKEELERRRNVLQAQVASRTVDHDALAAYEDFQQLLARIASSDARVFNSSVHVVVSGKNGQELDSATREVKKAFAVVHCVATTCVNRQLFSWLSTLPGNGHMSPNPYPLLSASCAHLTPYFQPSEGDQDADLLFATRQRSLHAVSWRQAGSRDNTNTFIIGSTGSGKTFLFSHIFKTTLALGGHVVITDIKGPRNSTYLPMCELLGGQYVALNATDGSVSFNPCPGHAEARGKDGSFGSEAIDHLQKIVCMMAVPDLDTTRDRDLYMRVASEGIRDAYAATAESARQPVLSDVARTLEAYLSDRDQFTTLAHDMGLRLRLWCEDRRRGALLDRPTSGVGDREFQVFDFFGLDSDPELAGVLISTLSSRIFRKMQELPLSTPKLFGFDEAWAFFDHSQVAANLIGSLFRVARSYGASCFVASQSHKDVSESRAATAMMANASIYVLNRMNADHEAVARVFSLSPRELSLLKSLQFRKGHFAESLHVDRHSSRSQVLRYAPTPWELWTDTSRAVDIELRNKLLDRLGSPHRVLDYLSRKHPHGAPSADATDEAAA
ncbi:MAG: hypothetical protein ABIJ09_17610 [Pseudomonadota bacterium]